MQLLISSSSLDPFLSADMSSNHICVKQVHSALNELSKVACDNASNLYFGSFKFKSL